MSLFDVDELGVRRVSLVKLSGEIARSLAGVGRVAVEGEVHRPQRTATGRVWFTLRDRACQVNVTCPPVKGRFRTVAGERVLVTGSLGYANDRGQLQLVAEEVAPVGAGAVAAAIEEARARLSAEGLLDRPRRRIPRLPTVIGVVCGTEAAVRADIESVVAARFPGYPVDFAEATVSGPGAADAIARALVSLDARSEVEVIILARGGGDAAQLLPFSDELLCRVIATSGTPVVSAVGHEGDRPLCDELADLRCGTPSLAAGAVVPSKVELEAELDRLRLQAQEALRRRFDRASARLGTVDRDRAVQAGLAVARGRLQRAELRLQAVHPAREVRAAADRLGRLDWHRPPRVALEQADARLSAALRHLEALSPAKVLERGYAVVRTGGGAVVRSAAAVSVGEAVEVQLADGRLGALVERTAR